MTVEVLLGGVAGWIKGNFSDTGPQGEHFFGVVLAGGEGNAAVPAPKAHRGFDAHRGLGPPPPHNGFTF